MSLRFLAPLERLLSRVRVSRQLMLLGIILMTVLIFIWLNYFTQRPAVGPEPGPPDGQTASGPAEPDRDAGPSAPASGAEAASGWPQLPPVPESVLPDDEITIENDQLRLVFTRIGARLKRAEVILDKEANDVVELVPHSDKPDTEAVYPLGLWFPAQQELGEVVYVEVPEPGQVFNAHDEIGTIESVKAVAEIFTPVAGEIVEANERLKDDPELINDDPHGDGWLVKVKFSSASDLDDLMDADAYEEYVAKGKE